MRTKPDKPQRSPLRTLTSSPPPSNTHALRKITNQAENRMLTRTAKEQLAEALADANRGPDDVIPDADDEAVKRAGVLA